MDDYHYADPNQMLVELFDLQSSPEGYQWKEIARWFKYEEDIEGIDQHRGRPHVSFLPFNSLIQLKKLFSTGTIIFDPPVYNIQEIIQLFSSLLVAECHVDMTTASRIANLLSTTRLRYRENRSAFPFLSRNSSVISQALSNKEGNNNAADTRKVSTLSTLSDSMRNGVMGTKKSIDSPDNAMECAHVYVGSFEGLDKMHLIMVRLLYGMYLPEIVDQISRVRFVVLIVGPYQPNTSYLQIGRSISTLMANQYFNQAAIDTDNSDMLISALDSFMSDSLILPPGDIDNKELFTLEAIMKATNRMKPRGRSITEMKDTARASFAKTRSLSANSRQDESKMGKVHLDIRHTFTDPFERTRRPFGGAINDIKNRLPYYWDDFKMALNFQCVTSILFIFCANFASAIALGEVLSEKTEGYMGVTEILIAHGVCGVIWGLIAGQPLCIQAAVGPFLVFEESLFNFCKSSGVDFLAARVWTAFWTFLLLTLCAMVEAPFLMKYLTSFTEEIFTGLVAVIFVWLAAKFMYIEFTTHPLQDLKTYCDVLSQRDIAAALFNSTHNMNMNMNFTYLNYTGPNSTYSNDTYRTYMQNKEAEIWENETRYQRQTERLTNQPDTALLQFILLIITFLVAYYLKKLRLSIYCGRTVRRAFGDFGVPLAVIVGTFVDRVIFSDVYTRHVEMKSNFEVTKPNLRGWFVNPMGSGKEMLPAWVIPATIVPALLVTILFYAEVEIIEKLLAKKERGLKKPSGFHWDLIVCGGSAFLCSLFGLQWMCPAAVQSLSHASSLAVMVKTAPGEAPRIDYVLEQRVTAIVVGLLHAAAAFCGVFLTLIPVSVLFGLFLYLGVMGLLGTQFFHRLVLLFVPRKYFPNQPFCQQITAKRLHMFTIIQFLTFAVLWFVNMFPTSALAFPFVLTLIAIFRMVVVSRIFTADELILIEGKQERIGEIVEDETMKKENIEKDFYEQTTTTG